MCGVFERDQRAAHVQHGRSVLDKAQPTAEDDAVAVLPKLRCGRSDRTRIFCPADVLVDSPLDTLLMTRRIKSTPPKHHAC